MTTKLAADPQQIDPMMAPAGTTFLKKLRDLLKGLVSPASFDTAVKQARGHAGGVAKARAQAQKAHDPYAMDPPDAGEGEDEEAEERMFKSDSRVNFRAATQLGQTCGDCRFFDEGTCDLVEGVIPESSVCDLFTLETPATMAADGESETMAEPASLGPWRLFVEMRRQAMEAPEWIPLMPRPGSFKHPAYGEIAITPERNANFVRNLKEGVYQRRLPIDAEHQTKLSGALGWITDARQNSDGSADGKVEWTDRGQKMLASNLWGFVSPEWYDSWSQPESGTQYQDVLIGAALTTRPFFKEGALRPLVASEGRLFEPDIQSVPATPEKGDPIMDQKVTPAAPVAVSPPVKAAEPTPASEPKTMAEMASELERTRQFAEQQAEANKQMSERIATMEVADRRKRFTDEVMGRSEASNIRWFGETERHVKIMETLASSFGETSEEFAAYIQQQRATAEQVRASELFKEAGRPGGAPVDGSAQAKAEAQAKTLREAKPDLTREQALERVFSENPALYDEYERQARR